MFVEVPMFSPLIKIFAPINVSLVCPSKTVPVRFVCAKQNFVHFFYCSATGASEYLQSSKFTSSGCKQIKWKKNQNIKKNNKTIR